MQLIFDHEAIQYRYPNHPECPERLIHSEAYLRKYRPDWKWNRPASAADDPILRVHSKEHLHRLTYPVHFDADTPYYDRILDHARRAAGAAIDAADFALGGEKAFCLMRPPGHHATRDCAMGFCYLNSIAIAAFHALDKGVSRVGIWDFDAHHGNGTESIARGNPGIVFASIHQYPGYPGTGTQSFENILNFPVPPYASPGVHAGEVERALEALLAFKPELILVSAGFDAYSGDPITRMSLEAENFREFGEWLREGGVPASAVLEGGYSDELPFLIGSFLDGWVGG